MLPDRCRPLDVLSIVDEETMRRMSLQLLEAVQHLHAENIIHRDITVRASHLPCPSSPVWSLLPHPPPLPPAPSHPPPPLSPLQSALLSFCLCHPIPISHLVSPPSPPPLSSPLSSSSILSVLNPPLLCLPLLSCPLLLSPQFFPSAVRLFLHIGASIYFVTLSSSSTFS